MLALQPGVEGAFARIVALIRPDGGHVGVNLHAGWTETDDSRACEARPDVTHYPHDLPGFNEMRASLVHLQQRVGNSWRSTSHREAYVMAAKMMRGSMDLREAAPASFDAAFSMDPEPPSR